MATTISDQPASACVLPKPPEAVIRADNITKIFKDFWGRPKAKALNNVSFEVGRGQVFGLLGPNGSGKSTTVKLLLGLLYPTRGDLHVLGQSPRQVDTKRHIGYLPEETYLYRYLTAAETLDFFGSLFGLSKDECKKRTIQLLDMVGLSASSKRRVGEFSKGMARRIGLAQALINDPELVILDEPTSGLDPIGCSEVKDVIRLLSERGKTILLCSHLLADVEDVCNEIVVLYGGRVRAQGSLDTLLRLKDRTQITAPILDGPLLEKVLNVLRQSLNGDDIVVSQPSVDLEEFFLDVVRRAKDERVETSGAQSGGAIAEYLIEGTPETRTAEQVLQSLAGGEPKTDAAADDRKGRADRLRSEADQEETAARLRALADEKPRQSSGDEPSPPLPPASEDESKTSNKLKNLLDRRGN